MEWLKRVLHRHHWERTWLTERKLEYESTSMVDGAVTHHARPTGEYQEICQCGAVREGYDLNWLVPAQSSTVVTFVARFDEHVGPDLGIVGIAGSVGATDDGMASDHPPASPRTCERSST